MTSLMPALFIGHSSYEHPGDNGYTRAWRRLEGLAAAAGVAGLRTLVHWIDGRDRYSASADHHDFYGFPDELFAFQYPAPGLPELAGEVAEVAKPTWVGADRDQWGLDHGTWSVLAHLFPQADVPVVQLSINALKPPEYHLELGARLDALRSRGVMILSSGNVVHNLRRIEWHKPNAGTDWAQRFDEAVVQQMTEAPGDILKTLEHSDFDLAVPTPDHFIPLLYTAGLAAQEGGAKALVRGYAMGSLSMTCYGVGTDGIPCDEGEGATQLPEGFLPTRRTSRSCRDLALAQIKRLP